jgi:hypothetical protein
MSALDNVLSIPSVKAKHPNLHAQATQELAELRISRSSYFDELKESNALHARIEELTGELANCRDTRSKELGSATSMALANMNADAARQLREENGRLRAEIETAQACVTMNADGVIRERAENARLRAALEEIMNNEISVNGGYVSVAEKICKSALSKASNPCKP